MKITEKICQRSRPRSGLKCLCNVCEIGEEQILRFLVNRRPACAKNLSERGLLAARGWVVKSGSHIWCLAPSRLWCLAPSRLWCLAPSRLWCLAPSRLWCLAPSGFGVLHHQGFGVLHHQGFGVLHQLCPLPLWITVRWAFSS